MRGASPTRQPTRVPAPLQNAPRSSEAITPHALIDETRLLRAIHALDEVSRKTHETNATSGSMAHDATRAFRAWGFFLDMTVALESANTEVDRQKIALVLEARVLSCVARFLAGHAHRRDAHDDDDDGGSRSCHSHPVWRQWLWPQTNCPDRCLAGVMRTVACCFLFQLSRDPSTAMLVMRSGLHTFLLDECELSSASPSTAGDSTSSCSCYDARDATVAVDAFDWATRALYVALQREPAEDACDAFVVPIGARALAHLLHGRRIPTNEAEEYSIAQHERSRTLDATPPASPLRPSSPQKQRTKPRRLPSMFTFPTQALEDPEASGSDCRVCAAHCDTEAWAAAARPSTQLHLAVRALVALALHIPPTSPEGKKLVRDGGLATLRRAAACTVGHRPHTDVGTEEAVASADENSHDRVVREIARAGLRLLEPVVDPLPTRDARASKPKENESTASVRSPLGDKLQAISERTRREAAQRQQWDRAAQYGRHRTAVRSRICDAYNKAMDTRTHLLRSLAVLSHGRTHPAGHDQSVVAWLDSFLTIEKKEQLRREQEEMRQRRLLETQYQIDARRRREREERMHMAQEDHDTPDTFAAERAEAQRAAFAKLQREMHELHAKEETEQRAHSTDEAVVAENRARAKREAQRVQLQADERKRQGHEADLMAREDHYYADKIVREKKHRDEQAQNAKLVDPLAEQQKRIAAMRRLDDEKQRSLRELELMRSEDLLARQRRFVEAEMLQRSLARERNACKQMDSEEKRSRLQWKLLEQETAKQQHADERQRYADARRAKRLQEQQWRQWQAAWVSTYDASGHVYYYNQLTGESQWGNPLDPTANGVATWQGTS